MGLRKRPNGSLTANRSKGLSPTSTQLETFNSSRTLQQIYVILQKPTEILLEPTEIPLEPTEILLEPTAPSGGTDDGPGALRKFCGNLRYLRGSPGPIQRPTKSSGKNLSEFRHNSQPVTNANFHPMPLRNKKNIKTITCLPHLLTNTNHHFGFSSTTPSLATLTL